MKRTVSLLLVICLFALPLFGCGKAPDGAGDGASDQTPEEPENPATDFLYEENEDGGITVTRYISDDVDVVIPAKIEGKQVTTIGESAFAVISHKLASVKVPEGVTCIERNAFADCKKLKKAELSNTVETIQESAFRYCEMLDSINLPESLTMLGEHAFQYDTSLKFIRIPKDVTTWGEAVFEFSGLESVEFEEGLESIGQSAFGTTNLKELSFPRSIKTVEKEAFINCEKIEKITLNEGLVTIGDGAFMDANISEIVIPASVQTIPENVFAHCYILRQMKFEGDAPTEFSSTEVVYSGEEFVEKKIQVHCTVYYHEGAKGFTSPIWEGYTTEIW